MRRITLATFAIFTSTITFRATIDAPNPSRALPGLHLVAANPSPPQDLPPGATKHPGEKCATTVQPPEYGACPMSSDAQCYAAHGTSYWTGACLAERRGFFSPPYNFQPRNPTEACINTRENGGGYDRSANPGHAGRWQDTYQLFVDNGGQPGTWDMPASPEEQDMVFVSIVTVDGYVPWLRWDGC